ncbi:integral membrane sensor signal transduction histidine kinase [Alkaliphilus metalliredigens QYMF]|uniref:histidine kinase n=1 Tax=Alkaliphilus metalliredigens (strain QYMF) TaxID=293826 RepID=A6TV25_ALKMQ|nr:sensor histidine kinase [Alkaliphilus metalliredigens]ABR50043.1 integral membrane sensor signal transduction histidine kinase [Alkaliphilus metalliredigens QYMF]
MFIAYVVCKKSWIGLIGLLLLLTNALIQFDAGIGVEPHSLIYLNFLFIIICVSFFIWRYKKETAYYKSLLTLSNGVGDDWFESIPSPHSRFPDSIVYKHLETIHEYEQNKRREDYSSQQMDHNDLASWVHEIKTPLTAMKITIDAHRSNELAQRLNAPWLRMHLLIDRQLYISRLGNLESDLLPEKLEVHDMIREEVRELSTWCMEKNISIDLTGNTSSSVYTDKKWCGFVMRQLLTNAIKYSPTDGNIFIHIGLHENEFVIVTIKDEGPGIEAHDLPRMFDKGFTGENGRVQHSATGMGLYLAKEISKKLHIRLEVDSAVGEGTSISMIFSSDNPFEHIRRSIL